MQEELKQIGLADDGSQGLFGMPEKYDYSSFLVDGFKLDEELLEKFAPIAKKLNLSQKSLEMLLGIALEMSKKQRAIYEKEYEIGEKTKLQNTISKYDKMFRDDPELPDLNSTKVKEYMNIANSAYNTFASDKLKDLFKSTGLDFHPELIKMFHKIGELAAADNINYDGKPVVEDLTPAQILYGKRD